MGNKQASFLPFNAINEFMTDEFRLQVVRSVLNRQADLPESHQSALNRLAKKTVQIPGFRNGAKAPAALKVKPFTQAFEKNPDLVAEVLSAWSELNPDLRVQVYDFLLSLSWEVLPSEADRTKLPGFLPQWPSNQDFDQINQVFREKYPASTFGSNDISLMVVWISGRLPVEVGEAGSDATSLSPEH